MNEKQLVDFSDEEYPIILSPDSVIGGYFERFGAIFLIIGIILLFGYIFFVDPFVIIMVVILFLLSFYLILTARVSRLGLDENQVKIKSIIRRRALKIDHITGFTLITSSLLFAGEKIISSIKWETTEGTERWSVWIFDTDEVIGLLNVIDNQIDNQVNEKQVS